MNKTYNFNVALKKIQQEGTLAWEYNPFRNYRLDEDMIFYRNQFYTLSKFKEDYISNDKFKGDKELIIDNTTYKFNDIILESDNDKNYSFQIEYKNDKELKYKECSDWSILGFSKTEEIPVFYQKGQLVDFITEELDFDLNHPVQITPQYSYDNSVDLIINDGKSLPKIINSRFSAIGKNKYRIIDRNGVNDTNIYDRGEQFKIDTSLYKITTKIPEIQFGGESFGGNLKIGNYHFYFKYCDLDGNESDFVAQSGLVSVFMGNTPNSIHSGFRDQNSTKRVRFVMSNLDQSYDYILVYYSRASGQEYQNRTTECVKILQKYKISSNYQTVIDITGFETIQTIPNEEINQLLQIYESAKTQAISQNMLFLGNLSKSNENHDLLSKLALFIYPQINRGKECDIDNLSNDYQGDITNTYYNPTFIYKYTGYWDDEIYRFGIVFIKENNTLSPVYNVRGLDLSSSINEDNVICDEDVKITFDETTFQIDTDFKLTQSVLENAKGVTYIPKQDEIITVIGITFKCHSSVIKKLESIGIKGFFVVRQKRIPTTLCQAYTIGVESNSHIPLIPIDGNKYVYESFVTENEQNYSYYKDLKKCSDTGYLLTHEFSDHCRKVNGSLVQTIGAICPDYDVNSQDLNTLFSGTNFQICTDGIKHYATQKGRMFNVPTKSEDNEDSSVSYKLVNVKIIGVEDDVKLVGIDNNLFSARAGDSEEAWRYESITNKATTEKGGNNIVRGSFGPYLGISGYKEAGELITIKIPGYNSAYMQDYFKIRYFDASPFYPISDRITWDRVEDIEEDIKELGTFYRGDCYICKFTHRINRNFRTDSAPTNDEIIDPKCWAMNIRYEDGILKTEDLDKINTGDVNSVNLGMWITFTLRSDINHSVRSLDESVVDEISLIGNCRGFYPYHPASARAAYKLPECGTCNKGFEASVGEQIFNELPVVPYYRDIYSTRIAYSNIQITSAFKNAYRVFQATHYRDYPITYGEITKIIEHRGDLICILEHGIYKIPINERVVAGEGSGGTVYINNSNVLPENPIPISDKFGSQWSDSIIKTPLGIYGVDTVAKKIWRVDNNGQFSNISDGSVQEFLNNNITFGERELTPIIGIRNVKTHFNAFKDDVMFTFYDDLKGLNECVWNLCWNEKLNQWVTFYSWVPSFSENIYNQYFSFDRETSKQIAKLALNEKSDYNDYIYLDNTQMTNKDDVETNKKYIGQLNYDLNFEGQDVSTSFKWEIVNDLYGNHKFFEIKDDGKLYYTKSYKDYVNDYIPSKSNPLEYNDKQYYISDNKWHCVEETLVYENGNKSFEFTKIEDNKWQYIDKITYTITYQDGKYSLQSLHGNLGGITVKFKTEVTNETIIYNLNKIRKQIWKESFINLEETSSFNPSFELPINPIKQKVYTLNIRVTPTITYNGVIPSYAESVSNKNANMQLTEGYIERTICVIPKEHLEALSTDFWRHGQAGIFDITEDIEPTKWYGKQHPFEFEFIVRDQPDTHKIFDNLVIISNKAEPESFHYEIIGECYEFAKDKKNMYIRQEATKELFQNSNYNITYNDKYKKLEEKHRKLSKNSTQFDKSTIFPAYYKRRDSLNTIEDYYHIRPNEGGKDFSYLSGSEIAYYKTLNEFRIQTHSEGIDIENEEKGRLRGNMNYKEDKWCVQIPSINLVQCNEPDWSDVYLGKKDSSKIPIELQQSNFIDAKSIDNVSPLDERGLVFWTNDKIRKSEVKLKDKYIKIRIRYSGENLAIISAIKTLYSISYG